MAEYIEREAAISELQRWSITADRPRTWMNAIDKAIEVVKAIPAADVAPVVRGKWKLATYSGKFGAAKEKWYDKFLDGAFWYCDSCKERANKRTNFCPNCGAKMEES